MLNDDVVVELPVFLAVRERRLVGGRLDDDFERLLTGRSSPGAPHDEAVFLPHGFQDS
jgi:hypothetical protein